MSDRFDLLADRLAERVADRLADLLADRVADALADREPPADELIDAAEVARQLGVDRSWVYANRAQLGGVKLGDGPKARLRFSPEAVAEYQVGASDEQHNGAPAKPARRQHRQQHSPELLPIRGSSS